jgi:hypothetical protein
VLGLLFYGCARKENAADSGLDRLPLLRSCAACGKPQLPIIGSEPIKRAGVDPTTGGTRTLKWAAPYWLLMMIPVFSK